MALLKSLLIQALCCALFVKGNRVVGRDEQTLIILAMLEYLNANPDRTFDYNAASLLSAENLGSVIEVSVEVEVSCNNNYPDIPCNEHTLICNAFMGRNALPPDGYMVLSDVRCSPRIEITMEEADDSIVGAPQANEDQRLDLSNEALQPGQERADFVAIRNKNDLCLGCPWDLNTDAEGVDELVDGALKHIESEKTQRLKITKVRRLQQEIVAGVKFILLAEVAQTTCQKDAEQSAVCAVDENTEPLVCEVTFIEQSWISKGKHIIKNNCTISQEFEPVHYSSSRRNDESNEIVPHKDLDISNPDGVQKREGHNFDAIAQTGNIESLIDPDHLADLESQILVDSFDTDTKVDNRKLLSTPHGQNNRFTVDEPLLISKDINVEPLSLQAQPLRTLYASIPIVDEAEPTGVSYIQQKDDLLNVLFDNDLPEARTVADSAEHPPPTRIDRNSFEERQFKRGAKNDSSSSESSESKSSSDSKSSEESKKPSQSVTLNGTDEGVTAKTKRHVEDTNESTSDSKDSSEEKNRPTRDTEDTNESASDSKDSSEERQRSRRDVAEMRETEPIIRKKRIVGQLEKILPEEKIIVRDLADFAATSMDNTDDDQHKRVILQILGAKKLKLDGIYYQIILRLGISHCNENEHNENCREKLFTNMTKICKVQVHVEDDYSNPKVVKSQCQNIKKDENDRNRTNYSRYRREVLVGAPSNLPVDHPQVKKIVKDTLIRLDSVSGHPNKHKSVEVVSATRQVVAGLRYVVTAKIGITYCKKSDQQLPETCNLLSDIEPETCTIVTLEQPWRNKTYLTVKCNDKVYDFGNVDDHARVKREPCVGCPVQLELSEAEKYLNIGLTHLDSTSNTGNRYISEEILNATTQVVAGQLVTVKARITESNCPKSTSVPKDCSKLEGRASQVCTFEIWEKTWLNFTKTDVYCDNGQNFTHTEVLYDDGPKEKRSKRDISDDELESVLEAGLQYLSEKRHLPGEYKFASGPDGLFRKLKLNDGTWQIDANIKLCQKRDLSACHAQAQSFCQFTVKRTESVLDGLKMTIKCDNDDEVYVYEPVSKLRDPELLKNGFLEFAKKYNKQYKNDNEFNFRLKVFRYNLDKIDFLNRFERGTARYGITQFADLTETEFSRSHGYRSDLRNDNELPFAAATIPNIELPTGFDWRTKGAVTEVKNQGLCGSCWAFSVTGNVEGQYALKHSSLLEFSEQELVDCDKVDEGCNGGLMDNAYRVIEKLGGLETESDYPYQGADEGCIFNKGKVKVQVTGAVNISHNETDMAKWLVQNGPISIAINANAMQFYFGGISHPWELLCDPSDLDHGVLIVGYGVHSYALFNRTIPYWIVKNSWGPSWGEQGYYRVFRGDGTCGLNQTPSSAIVA